jgi:hypothetical protein
LRPGAPAAPARPARGTAGFGALLDTPDEVRAQGEAEATAAVTLPMSYDIAHDAVRADRDARRHGRALLHALGAMQLALLGSGDSDEAGEATAQLARLAASEPAADDPVLRLILREIGVRAAVELARLDA